MATISDGPFEWDVEKAAANVRKHGITFEAATQVFADPNAYAMSDVLQAERALIVGYSFDRLLTVVYIEREPGGILRIISARKAAREERRIYEEGP